MADSLRRGRQYQYQDLSYVGGGEYNFEATEVKQALEGWREVLIPLASLFRWDKPYYPAVIVGLTSLIFLLVWYLELSALTTVSLACMIAGIVDFIIPFVGSTITGYKTWTEVEESQYLEICAKLAAARQGITDSWKTLAFMRQQNSKAFFIFLMGALAMTAWIGSLVDNLILTYLLVTGLLLYPGFRHKQLADAYVQPVLKFLNRIKANTPTSTPIKPKTS